MLCKLFRLRTLAFTTLSGSDGITSLVGTTGVDTATLVNLESDVFVGGNTGNDTLQTLSGTGNINNVNYTVRMGGGNDGVILNDNLLNSDISLDGTTLANDGNDVLTVVGANTQTVNSTIRGLGGNDTITLSNVQSSSINGNTGNDQINTGAANRIFSSATVLGGQGTDTMTFTVDGSGNIINGNRGADVMTVGAGANNSLASSTIFGGQGNDVITTTANNIDGNIINGDLGDDTLVDGAGSNDVYNGGEGADAITSTAGADTLSGGAGIDVFTIGNGTAVNLNGTVDNFAEITDFSAAAGETINVDMNGTVAVAGLENKAAIGTSSNVDLFSNLTGTSFDGTNNVATITLTASTVGAAFAGTYILVQDGAAAAAAFGADDLVIKANTANLQAADITVV